MLLAKIACGFAGTLVLAGAYTFREGVIRISVDEHKLNGEHHHLIVPAAAIPLAARFVPDREIQRAAEQASLLLPALREFAKQLRKMPDADLVEIRDNRERVQIRAEAGKLRIDVDSPEETVHVSCPLLTIEDLAEELASRLPAA